MVWIIYLLLRCILKVGLWMKTIRRTVFNDDPIINIKLYKITNISHEVPFPSAATLFISIKLSLMFSMIKRNRYFLLSKKGQFHAIFFDNCTCYKFIGFCCRDVPWLLLQVLFELIGNTFVYGANSLYRQSK